jgi:hypothetical protein
MLTSWSRLNERAEESSVKAAIGSAALLIAALAAVWFVLKSDKQQAAIGSPTGVQVESSPAVLASTAAQAPPTERPAPAGPERPPVITTSRPEEIPDEALNAERIRGFLSLNKYDLLPLEVECEPDLYGDYRCTPVPGTLITEHPYFTYPIESLAALPGDAIAQQVLSLRLANQDPDVAFQHAIWAVGLSNGKPGPLVDFVQNSSWGAVEINGEAAVDNLMRGYVALEAARRLGHEQVDPAAKLAMLSGNVSEQVIEQLDREVELLLQAIRAVPPAREYES